MPAIVRRAFLEEWLRSGGEDGGFDLILRAADDDATEVDEFEDIAAKSDSSVSSGDSDDNDLSAGVSIGSGLPTTAPPTITVTASGATSTLTSVSRPNPNLEGGSATPVPASSTPVPTTTAANNGSNPQPVGGASSNGSNGKSNTGTIVAAVIASLIGAFLLGLLLYVCLVKRRRRAQTMEFTQAYPFAAPQQPLPQDNASLRPQPPRMSTYSSTPVSRGPTYEVEKQMTRDSERNMFDDPSRRQMGGGVAEGRTFDRGPYYDQQDFPTTPRSFIQEPPPTVGNGRRFSRFTDRLSVGGRSFKSVSVRGGRQAEFPTRY